MGGVGCYGGRPGLNISSAYFVSKLIINNLDTIETVMTEADEVNRINQDITGENNWGRPKF